MNLGLYTVDNLRLSKAYNISDRAARKWSQSGDEPAPRKMGNAGRAYFMVCDLIPRVHHRPFGPLLEIDRKHRQMWSNPYADLGLQVQKRARDQRGAMERHHETKFAEIEAAFRSAVVDVFWEKVQFVEMPNLIDRLCLHSDIVQVVFGKFDLPDDETWTDWVTSFVIANSKSKAVKALARSKTPQQAETKQQETVNV